MKTYLGVKILKISKHLIRKKSAKKVKKWYMYRNKKIKIYLWVGVSITEKKYIHDANTQR